VKRRIISRDREAFNALFTGVRESWFRLETLQTYNAGEAEELREFLAGRPRPHRPGAWQVVIRNHAAAGRTLCRVHVIREPPTDYVRWELYAYGPNIEAGEDVRAVPVPEGAPWPAGIPEGLDFWLFDDRDVWVMEYDDTGRFLACELVSDQGEVEQYRAWRDAALAASIPVGDYHPDAAAVRRVS
jgi:hypothetical protein